MLDLITINSHRQAVEMNPHRTTIQTKLEVFLYIYWVLRMTDVEK